MFPIQWDSKLPYGNTATSERLTKFAALSTQRFSLRHRRQLSATIAEQLKDLTQLIVVEYGIGYQGVFSRWQIFESYAICTSSWVFKTLTAMATFTIRGAQLLRRFRISLVPIQGG